MQCMLLFTDRGPRNIDDCDVIAVYCGDTLGGSILLRQLCSLRSAASAVPLQDRAARPRNLSAPVIELLKV
jgi:hypothetical protein